MNTPLNTQLPSTLQKNKAFLTTQSKLSYLLFLLVLLDLVWGHTQWYSVFTLDYIQGITPGGIQGIIWGFMGQTCIKSNTLPTVLSLF